jgi:outer membrane lipoprotein LolB
MIFRVVLAASVLLLAACRPPAISQRDVVPLDGEPAQRARELALVAAPDWSFDARVAVAQGGQGGSARMTWVQRGEAFDITLAAPITGQRWRLYGGPGGATLDGLPAGPQSGADPEALLFAATGWRLPVRDLPQWLRGARGSGPADLRWDGEGRPQRLAQAGWVVEYRDWHAGALPLPRRVFATQGDASVRLVIEAWR